MPRIAVCTHKKHPGPIKRNKYDRKCRRNGGCPWLEYEEVKDQFIDNHKRF